MGIKKNNEMKFHWSPEREREQTTERRYSSYSSTSSGFFKIVLQITQNVIFTPQGIFFLLNSLLLEKAPKMDIHSFKMHCWMVCVFKKKKNRKKDCCCYKIFSPVVLWRAYNKPLFPLTSPSLQPWLWLYIDLRKACGSVFTEKRYTNNCY